MLTKSIVAVLIAAAFLAGAVIPPKSLSFTPSSVTVTEQADSTGVTLTLHDSATRLGSP